ncbi:hypothetical protein JW921_07260 [Candidatus Fermentibacterales bacterium]|nr:hypothetical protein [Candidatus Fermentibacterales bacterium]
MLAIRIPGTGRGGRRGSALALVVLFAFGMSILAAAIYTLFRINMTSFIYDRDKMQARYTSEAGANLAMHMILGGASVPGDTMPEYFMGSQLVWLDLPGNDLGEVKVVVDPSDANPEITEGNSYEIRSLGKNIGEDNDNYYHGTRAYMMPENFARFAAFLSTPNLGGFYGDGYRFDGPFFANGPICIWSQTGFWSPDEPMFYSLGLASPHYYYSTGGASNPTSVPHVGGLWIEPYDRMLLGPPYFEMNADPIEFGPDEVDWQTARNAAMSNGIYFAGGAAPSGTRMIVRGDTLIVKTSQAAAEQRFCISDYGNPVVWVDNNNTDNLYLKTYPSMVDTNFLTVPLTIGMRGNLYMAGSFRYANEDCLDPSNKILAGFITVYGDILMAHDPETTGGADWAGIWEVETFVNWQFNGVLMALSGEIRAENYWYPQPSVDLTILGGYIVVEEGITTTTMPSGFDWAIHYDTRLMSMHPPFFPSTGKWDLIAWWEDPSMNEHWLDLNLY